MAVKGQRQRGNNYFILTLRLAWECLSRPAALCPTGSVSGRENAAKGDPAAHLPVSYLSTGWQKITPISRIATNGRRRLVFTAPPNSMLRTHRVKGRVIQRRVGNPLESLLPPFRSRNVCKQSVRGRFMTAGVDSPRGRSSFKSDARG